jgi:hypothetical protein
MTILPVLPKRKINIGGYKSVMGDLLEEEADEIMRLIKLPTSGWKRHKISPRKTKIKVIGYDWEIHAGVLHSTKGNLVLSWISHGTGPRDIPAYSPKGPMVFPVGYKAATSPNKLAGGTRSKFGPIAVTRLVKDHSINPREFDKAVARRRRGYFIRKGKGRMSKTPFWK